MLDDLGTQVNPSKSRKTCFWIFRILKSQISLEHLGILVFLGRWNFEIFEIMDNYSASCKINIWESPSTKRLPPLHRPPSLRIPLYNGTLWLKSIKNPPDIIIKNHPENIRPFIGLSVNLFDFPWKPFRASEISLDLWKPFHGPWVLLEPLSPFSCFAAASFDRFKFNAVLGGAL